MAHLYAQVLAESWTSTHMHMWISIDQLQEWRPDLTDQVLTEAGFVRGVHAVYIAGGKIMPYLPPAEKE